MFLNTFPLSHLPVEHAGNPTAKNTIKQNKNLCWGFSSETFPFCFSFYLPFSSNPLILAAPLFYSIFYHFSPFPLLSSVPVSITYWFCMYSNEFCLLWIYWALWHPWIYSPPSLPLLNIQSSKVSLKSFAPLHRWQYACHTKPENITF